MTLFQAVLVGFRLFRLLDIGGIGASAVWKHGLLRLPTVRMQWLSWRLLLRIRPWLRYDSRFPVFGMFFFRPPQGTVDPLPHRRRLRELGLSPLHSRRMWRYLSVSAVCVRRCNACGITFFSLVNKASFTQNIAPLIYVVTICA